MPQPNNYQPPKNRCINQPFIVVGCLIEQDEKFLLVEENGKYNLPQGWLELGEELATGAKREAEEETGLEVKIFGLNGIYTLIKQQPEKTLHKIKFIFQARLTGKNKTGGSPLPYTWFSLKDIKSDQVPLWDIDTIDIIERSKNTSNNLDLCSSYFKTE